MLCRFDQSWQPITLKWIGWQCSNASIQFCSSTITNSYLMFVFFDNDNDIDTFCHRMAVIVYSWQTSNFVGSMWLVEIGFMHHCKHSIHHFVCVCVCLRWKLLCTFFLLLLAGVKVYRGNKDIKPINGLKWKNPVFDTHFFQCTFCRSFTAWGNRAQISNNTRQKWFSWGGFSFL